MTDLTEQLDASSPSTTGGWQMNERESEETRYFVTGPDNVYPMSLEHAIKEVNDVFDNSGIEGWPEDMDNFTVWKAVPISKAVMVAECNEIDCPACCGGKIEEEFPEEECPNCEGARSVRSDDTRTPWPNELWDAITEYEMRPPLPKSEGDQ